MMADVVAMLAGSRAGRSLIGSLERVTSADPGRLPVLTYHRIDRPERRPDLYPGLVSATPEAFEEQVRHIASALRPISLEELLAVRAGRSRLAPGSVLVTFDDAYVDVAEAAAPILARHGVPSVLFVPTAYPDAPDRAFWWDRLHAALRAAQPPFELHGPAGSIRVRRTAEIGAAFRRLVATIKQRPHDAAMSLVADLLAQLPAVAASPAVSGWDVLRRLPQQGMALAPHSHSHPRLDRLTPDALRDELERPRAVFRERLGYEAPPVMAYPDGAHDASVVAAVGRAGYAIAFTTARGMNSMRAIDWLRLRRVNVGRRSNLSLIRAQLLATRHFSHSDESRAIDKHRADAAEEATPWN